MSSTKAAETVVQCDFDGTITEEDMGYCLLESFADGDWRQLVRQYRQGEISVNYFNTRAFAMVKADRHTLLKFVRNRARVRDGIHELVTYCRGRGFQFVIVSNGLDFYIKALLRDIGMDDIMVFAALTRFTPGGIEAWYTGPDGNRLEDGFKEAYTRLFLSKGYRVVYVGNGISDISPARQAHYIFATGELVSYCKESDIDCIPFFNLHDVVRGLKLLPPE
jgi:2-hydroxy-3-keto-5-methylthiopentenyl-1-phosphate phosphatase